MRNASKIRSLNKLINDIEGDQQAGLLELRESIVDKFADIEQDSKILDSFKATVIRSYQKQGLQKQNNSEISEDLKLQASAIVGEDIKNIVKKSGDDHKGERPHSAPISNDAQKNNTKPLTEDLKKQANSAVGEDIKNIVKSSSDDHKGVHPHSAPIPNDAQKNNTKPLTEDLKKQANSAVGEDIKNIVKKSSDDPKGERPHSASIPNNKSSEGPSLS